jgi:hypothetical protein
MRLSVDPTDSGYVREALGSRVRVLLDGVEIRCVFTADEERGLVIVADLDEFGRSRLDHARRAIRKKTLYGLVRVEIPPDSLLGRSLGTR